MVQTGLIFGLLLGAVLQDWHFNFARQIHNGLTKQSGNGLLSLIVIIVVESAIVAALLLAGVLTIPANPDYAPAATIVGSLLFGLGMWLAHGCIVDNFVQVGNGDLNGLLALLAFTLTLVYYNWGVLSDRLGALNSEQVSDDLFHGRITGFLLCLGILAVITVAWLVWARMASPGCPTPHRPPRGRGLPRQRAGPQLWWLCDCWSASFMVRLHQGAWGRNCPQLGDVFHGRNHHRRLPGRPGKKTVPTAAAYDYQPHQLNCGWRPDGGRDRPFQGDLDLQRAGLHRPFLGPGMVSPSIYHRWLQSG